MTATWRLIEDDCVTAMAAMPEASVDSIVTDPPYHLRFMGRAWDHAPSPRESQASHERWAREALRVLKPGAYLIAAGGSRTYHRMTCAIEDAGFEIRDCITWLYGSGFPKSLNVSDALRRLPACTCDVTRKFGAVDSSGPARPVGTSIGTEPGAVPLAGFAANVAGGVGANVGADASDTLADVDRRVEKVIGDGSPIVLGTSTVAGLTAGNEVSANVRSVEVEPEPLRDDVVGDGGNVTAVNTDRVSQDAGTDLSPSGSLVRPFAATPSGVTGASQAGLVSDGHASARAIDGHPLAITDSAGSTYGTEEVGTGHLSKCKACGGVRGQILAGYGTALKPAAEFWVVARKPLVGTVASNILEFGTGALNIDGCRIGTGSDKGLFPDGRQILGATSGELPDWQGAGQRRPTDTITGRWPANVTLTHAPECRQVGTRRVQGHTGYPNGPGGTDNGSSWASHDSASTMHKRSGPWTGYADIDGLETVEAWECVESCPVRILDEQTAGVVHGAGSARDAAAGSHNGGMGVVGFVHGGPAPRYGDTGGASRFFYTAKASSVERNAGLNGFEERAIRDTYGDGLQGPRPHTTDDYEWQRKGARNIHPTVKPIDLMRWLVKLVTPPGGTVLDPFAGSGTTGIAAVLEGFDFVGIERQGPGFVKANLGADDYVAIARARIAWWEQHPEGIQEVRKVERRLEEAAERRRVLVDAGQHTLFGDGEAA